MIITNNTELSEIHLGNRDVALVSCGDKVVYFKNAIRIVCTKDQNKIFANTDNQNRFSVDIKADTPVIIHPSGLNNLEVYFYQMNLKEIEFIKINDDEIGNLNSMLSYNSDLTKVDLNNLTAKNATNLSYMLAGCTNLETIDLSRFDTRYVKNFNSMFLNCKALSSINIDNFNFDNAENLNSMFNSSGLVELSLPNLKAHKCNNISAFVAYSTSIKSVELPNFNPGVSHKASNMFAMCTSLERINVQSWDVSVNGSDETFADMIFRGCNKLNYIKCKRNFKEYIQNSQSSTLPNQMKEGGSATWDLVD